MKRALAAIWLSAWVFTFASAQDYYELNIPFRVNGQNLAFPLAGGLNNPQPNAVDLNNDGKLDLYIFDRTGDVHLTFLNTGAAGESKYTYAPYLEALFPEGLADWVVLRDYNGDGVMDLFTQAQAFSPFQGIAVFRGFIQDGRIAFERVPFEGPDDVLQFTLYNGTKTQIYVSNVDYPAIDDVDCDGDLDILTFNPSGGYIEYYQNRSIEMGYGRDSLIYRLEDDCWGGIFESGIDIQLGLAPSPGDCYNLVNPPVVERHPGSTLLLFDADNDGDKELVLGDVSFDSVNFLHNGGSCNLAWVDAQDPTFPSYDIPVNLPVFPATFYLDVNNDGKKDFLAAPNANNISENHEVLWYYQNVNTAQEPVFEYRQNDFMVEDMLDFGSVANPAFVDYNADGLLDLVVGNGGYYQLFGERDSRLFLYENIGTPTSPAYELVDDDFLNLDVFDDYYSFVPAFGDLDNDGDMDILVGETLGRLFYAENTAGPGNPVAYGPWQYNYMNIFVGALSAPYIVDLNRDGLPDLLVGERTGNINYYQNTGTPTAPAFNGDSGQAPNIFALGNINTAVPGAITGYSSPVVLDQDGAYVLITGTEVGQLEFYNGIEGNISGAYNLVTEQMGGIRVGRRTRPAIADIDHDGKLELFVGNERGGLTAYQTNLFLDSTSPSRDVNGELRVEVFPNPTGGLATVRLEGPGEKRLELYSATGQLVLARLWQGSELSFPTGGLPGGVYWLKVVTQGRAFAGKLVVKE
ncbi:MAG: T9SS type A sorting domain-containing protein [Phaeodactylibacter sp.]|nr:T9SS type A sorting domain-containing protein [Phaeodactylibacter sp.]MCB9274063.1 T9SS type A sorting domain-containing protein [Lewinellaceae bacterium]